MLITLFGRGQSGRRAPALSGDRAVAAGKGGAAASKSATDRRELIHLRICGLRQWVIKKLFLGFIHIQTTTQEHREREREYKLRCDAPRT